MEAIFFAYHAGSFWDTFMRVIYFRCYFPVYPGWGGCCVAMTQRKRWAWGRDTALAWCKAATATPQEERGEEKSKNAVTKGPIWKKTGVTTHILSSHNFIYVIPKIEKTTNCIMCKICFLAFEHLIHLVMKQKSSRQDFQNLALLHITA